ncbi:putative reverse transcriptase domain-containing protein [Tanacetum coccineum]
MSAPIVKEEIIEPAGEDSFDFSGTRDGIARSIEDMPIDLDNAVRNFYHHMSEEEFCQVRRDRDDTRGRLRRNDDRGGDGNGNDTGNGNNGGDNGDANKNRNVNRRGDRPGAHECTYQDFMKCTTIEFKGTKIGLLGHPFNIDLMPIDLGSFDVIIGMDWLAKNYAVIVCDEKIVRIPYENEILIVQGDKSDKEKKSTLSIISCEKPQKYTEKGCQIFLAQVTMKENKYKSKEKRLEDVPTVRDFSEVFPEDLPGLPPIRQVEF